MDTSTKIILIWNWYKFWERWKPQIFKLFVPLDTHQESDGETQTPSWHGILWWYQLPFVPPTQMWPSCCFQVSGDATVDL